MLKPLYYLQYARSIKDGKIIPAKKLQWGVPASRHFAYQSKDIWGRKCERGRDGRVKGYYDKDIFGRDCFRGTDGKVKGYRNNSWW